MSPSTGVSAQRVGPADEPTKKRLGAAARRALAEAEERRSRPAPPAAPEVNGRDGLDPVRYGDWEVKGLASDF
jgi:hypothetical protein